MTNTHAQNEHTDNCPTCEHTHEGPEVVITSRYGIRFYWAESLGRWVTIPEDEDKEHADELVECSRCGGYSPRLDVLLGVCDACCAELI